MQKKKILITGGKGMLAYDFYRTQKEKYEIILVDREECDITSFEEVMQCISLHEPDILLNCAAYTAVDDAEDIGARVNYDVNALGVYYLAKATSVFGVEFITISTDYVFDGQKSDRYLPTDTPNPINAYGMAKYLGERLAMSENPRTIIIRTSWLYGGELYDGNSDGKGIFKNFVNTMLRLSETLDEIKVVDDQHGRPTSCIDLSEYIASHVEKGEDVEGGIYHFSSPRKEFSITWADFAEEIFAKYEKSTKVVRCGSSQYPTKAVRPAFSLLINNSEIVLRNWRDGSVKYMEK